MLLYGCFHFFRTLVVKNVEFWADACCYDSDEEGDVLYPHLGVSPVFQWGNYYAVGVYLYHEHYIFVPALVIEKEAAGLV